MARPSTPGGKGEQGQPRHSAGPVLVWESGLGGSQQLALSLGGEGVERKVEQPDRAAQRVEPPVDGVSGAPEEGVGGAAVSPGLDRHGDG